MREVTLAAVQMETTNDMHKNLDKAMGFVEKAANRGAQFVCLPEAWISHSPEKTRSKEEFQRYLVSEGDEYLTKLAECVRKNKIYLVAGSTYEREGGKIYNTSFIFEPNGSVLGKVRKNNLENAPIKGEVDHEVTVGSAEYNVFETDYGKIAVLIDVDIIALEVARILGLKGAEILFWPLSWPSDAHDATPLYGKAAAVMMEGFVVVANRFGSGKYFSMDYYNGGSGIIDLRNYVAYVRDWHEGVAVTTVDLDRIAERLEMIKEIYPYYRRPESYSLLLDVEAERKMRGGSSKYANLPR
jgi:N-carbamoylputrescine amidase